MSQRYLPDALLAVPDPRARPTLTVKEAAGLLGISLHGAYDAAHRGELPVIWIGRRMLVPTAALMAMVGLDGSPAPSSDDAP
jgi:excisionase family DNA binding protein